MAFAELHCVSNFTFLRGASHPWELVETASALGYTALAITDECSLAGVVKAHVAAQNCGLPLIIGAEFQLQGQRLIALVSNRQSYGELSALITLARRRSSKGEYRLEWPDFSGKLPNTLLIWLPSGDLEPDHEVGERLSYWFKDRLWIGVEHLLDGNETYQYYYYRNLAALWQLPMVACGDVHMHSKERSALQDPLTAIHHNRSVLELADRTCPTAAPPLPPLPHLAHLYPAALLTDTFNIDHRCQLHPQAPRPDYPPHAIPLPLIPA